MADIQLELTAPSALDATDKAVVRRGATDPYTIELVALGGAATLAVGATAGTVAAGDHTHTSAAVTDFTEAAQDAVGAMVDATLVYTDATPALGRAALTGAVTASAGSNATSLGSFTVAQLNAALSDADIATGGGTATGTNTGDQTITLTGDVTGSGSGSFAATIASDAVTNAKMANMATSTIKGRATAGTGDPEDLTGLQVSSLISTAALVTAAPGSDQSNWSPSGFGAGVTVIKAQPTTNSFITGLTAGTTDQVVTLFNDSLFVICLEPESTASTAANRFAKTVDAPWILPNQSVVLRYSATLSRWVIGAQSKPIDAFSKTSQAIIPSTGSTVGVLGIGTSAATATISTVSGSASPTDAFLEYGYFQGTNSTGSGTTSVRGGNSIMFMRGATADRQGFVYCARVRFPALGATGAVRAGMTSSAAALTTLNAALTQCLLLGADTSMTTLRIFRGDGAAGTPIDLGANFPVPSATAAYDVLFYAPPNASYVRYMVRRLDTRFVAEGSLTANLPTNTTGLMQRVEAMVGATAVANTWQAAFSIVVGL